MGKVIKHSEGAKSRLYGTFKANQQPGITASWGNGGEMMDWIPLESIYFQVFNGKCAYKYKMWHWITRGLSSYTLTRLPCAVQSASRAPFYSEK